MSLPIGDKTGCSRLGAGFWTMVMPIFYLDDTEFCA